MKKLLLLIGLVTWYVILDANIRMKSDAYAVLAACAVGGLFGALWGVWNSRRRSRTE